VIGLLLIALSHSVTLSTSPSLFSLCFASFLAHAKVPLLLEMGEESEALTKATQSGDSDLCEYSLRLKT
jgi:hypothetical protein